MFFQNILIVVLAAIIIIYLLGRLALLLCGEEEIVVDTSAPFTVKEKAEDHITLEKKLAFKNLGDSCATIMDAIARPQVPYEQYDGITFRGKAEREGAPREDDYFESVLIQKKGDKNKEDALNLYAQVTLTARKGMRLEDALAEMTGKKVELAVDFIWMETGRSPWHYRKLRLAVSPKELAELTGVTPKED